MKETSVMGEKEGEVNTKKKQHAKVTTVIVLVITSLKASTKFVNNERCLNSLNMSYDLGNQ